MNVAHPVRTSMWYTISWPTYLEMRSRSYESSTGRITCGTAVRISFASFAYLHTYRGFIHQLIWELPVCNNSYNDNCNWCLQNMTLYVVSNHWSPMADFPNLTAKIVTQSPPINWDYWPTALGRWMSEPSLINRKRPLNQNTTQSCYQLNNRDLYCFRIHTLENGCCLSCMQPDGTSKTRYVPLL